MERTREIFYDLGVKSLPFVGQKMVIGDRARLFEQLKRRFNNILMARERDRLGKRGLTVKHTWRVEVYRGVPKVVTDKYDHWCRVTVSDTWERDVCAEGITTYGDCTVLSASKQYANDVETVFDIEFARKARGARFDVCKGVAIRTPNYLVLGHTFAQARRGADKAAARIAKVLLSGGIHTPEYGDIFKPKTERTVVVK